MTRPTSERTKQHPAAPVSLISLCRSAFKCFRDFSQIFLKFLDEDYLLAFSINFLHPEAMITRLAPTTEALAYV
jgi:hypothetical protein